MNDKTLITIFTYNESENIEKILVLLTKKFKNILVVDNNSNDHTVEIVNKFKIYSIKHKYNLGKSNSMKTAINFADIMHFKYILYMDGDGQHSVDDVSNLIKEMNLRKSDILIGYRKDLNSLNLQKKVGTVILERIFYVLFKKNIKDIQSGLRIIDLKICDKIMWQSTGSRHYFADAEISVNAVKKLCKVDQIPIKTIKSKELKGMNIFEGLYLVLMLFFWRFGK